MRCDNWVLTLKQCKFDGVCRWMKRRNEKWLFEDWLGEDIIKINNKYLNTTKILKKIYYKNLNKKCIQ